MAGARSTAAAVEDRRAHFNVPSVESSDEILDRARVVAKEGRRVGACGFLCCDAARTPEPHQPTRRPLEKTGAILLEGDSKCKTATL